MKRTEMLLQLQETPVWDMVIIGGGATGLGAALDAASRGYRTLLLERSDFAQGTSSRSTKLVHGGVRYLEQGNIKFVIEALKERGYLLKNAPHLTNDQPFVLPVYSYFQKWYYGFGLMLYDYLSGKLSLGKTKILSRKKTLLALPALNPKKLAGGILYYDGQFDDARLAMDIATAAAEHGAVLLNYAGVTGFKKENGKISRVECRDRLSGELYSFNTKVVINATGVFSDAVMQLDDPEHLPMIAPSQGIHLVVDTRFFPGGNALIIPKTDDERVLFAVPWNGKILLGTTDTLMEHIDKEPRPLPEEISFIITHFNRYCNTQIAQKDVLSVFAGLRPLVIKGKKQSSSETSRDHTIVVAVSNLVTITGGKWTTYRKMAEDAVNNALFVGKLEKKECITESLMINELPLTMGKNDPLSIYGNKAQSIRQIMDEHLLMAEKIHPDYAYTIAELNWIIANEMPQKLEDILARRARLLFLDARAAMDCCELVAGYLQLALEKDEKWKLEQVREFKILAQQYLLS